MQYSLDNPPKLYARNAAGRLIQIAGHPGEIGRYDNVVVPDERDIHRLCPTVEFLARLKPTSFNDGKVSHLERQFKPSTSSTLVSDPFNHLDNLPLFQKL